MIFTFKPGSSNIIHIRRFQRAEVSNGISHYRIHLQSLGHRNFVFGDSGNEHTGYTLASVVGDLSGYNAVRQGESGRGERTHRRQRSVTIAESRYGIVIVRTEFHGVILVGVSGQRGVHRHLWHECGSHAVATQGTRNSKIREAVLVLGDGPLQAYTVVGLTLGGGQRSDDRIAGGSHSL